MLAAALFVALPGCGSPKEEFSKPEFTDAVFEKDHALSTKIAAFETNHQSPGAIGGGGVLGFFLSNIIHSGSRAGQHQVLIDDCMRQRCYKIKSDHANQSKDGNSSEHEAPKK